MNQITNAIITLIILNNLKKIFQVFQHVDVVRGIEHVKANVPFNAEYVTLVDMIVTTSPVGLSPIHSKLKGASDTILGTESTATITAFRYHDTNDLKFVANNNELLSTPISNIIKLQMISILSKSHLDYKRSGFICSLKDGRSIIVSTSMLVETTSDSQYRTVGMSTYMTGGWAKELEIYNIPTVY